MEIPDGSRISDRRARLGREHPALVPLWPRIAIAMDGRIVPPGTCLEEGAEVPLLPPVSGVPRKPLRAELTDEFIDTGRVEAAVASPSRGASAPCATTTPGVPSRSSPTAPTAPWPWRGSARIVIDFEAAHEDLRAAIVHRLGEVPVGEPSLVIAIGSPHRAAAYNASRTALEFNSVK